MPLHHVIASPNLQGGQATTSLRPVPSLSAFCREFMSLRIKCRMAPTLFSLAASRMSRPRIPFKSEILFKKWRKDMFGELKGTNSRIGRNMKKLKSAKQWSQDELTAWRRKNSGQHAKLEHAQKNKISNIFKYTIQYCIPLVPDKPRAKVSRGKGPLKESAYRRRRATNRALPKPRFLGNQPGASGAVPFSGGFSVVAFSGVLCWWRCDVEWCDATWCGARWCDVTWPDVMLCGCEVR